MSKIALVLLITIPLTAAQPHTDSLVRRTITQIDYVDKDRKRSGCYARATFVGLELEAAGLTPVNVFAFGEFLPEPDVFFDYHVAAGFFDSSSNIRVIDPIFDDKPLTIERWRDLLKPQNSTFDIVVRPMGEFDDPKKISQRPSTTIDQVLATVAKVQPRQLFHACSVLHRFLEFKSDRSSRERLQNKLKQRYSLFTKNIDKTGWKKRFAECGPSSTQFQARPKIGTFQDRAWNGKELTVRTLDSRVGLVLAFRFTSRDGRLFDMHTEPFDPHNSEGYIKVFIGDSRTKSENRAAGFLSLSEIRTDQLIGELFGNPFAAKFVGPTISTH